ncbi:MAG TPA: hypothetical protein VK595_14080 [Vicinamibacterales bacterium]|nr:hypothetical protein [Vicinamibacterales bacterium]
MNDTVEYASKNPSRMRGITPGGPAETMRPSQTASNSLRVIILGRGEEGCTTRAPLLSAFPTSRNPPSRSDAIPGSGMPVNRVQSVVRERTPSPN